jgi:hypothetical protein
MDGPDVPWSRRQWHGHAGQVVVAGKWARKHLACVLWLQMVQVLDKPGRSAPSASSENRHDSPLMGSRQYEQRGLIGGLLQAGQTLRPDVHPAHT